MVLHYFFLAYGEPPSLHIEIFLYFRKAFIILINVLFCFLSSFSGPPVLRILASFFIYDILLLNAIYHLYPVCPERLVVFPRSVLLMVDITFSNVDSFITSNGVFVSSMISFLLWVPPIYSSSSAFYLLLSLFCLLHRIHVLYSDIEQNLSKKLTASWDFFLKYFLHLFLCYIPPHWSLHRLCVGWFLCTCLEWTYSVGPFKYTKYIKYI